ncbi:hypothetical protein KAU88_06150 [Candidatus Bathyarchaeota archaeon]|nr:hypothetical protein [Candidatus Bathyarchaeota archaeon]
MKVKCLLCADHSDDDIGYVQCPLLKDVICHACCIEISHGAEDTREEVMKRLGLTTEDEIHEACSNCKLQWVKQGTSRQKMPDVISQNSESCNA